MRLQTTENRHTVAFVVRAALTILAVAGSEIAVAQVYITPATPTWGFFEETPTGSGAFVNGPSGGPAGSSGSIQITVAAPGGELFATGNYSGISVSQLAGITYSTYVASSAIPETANLQFDFDPGIPLVPPFAGYQGRAVFAPSQIAPEPVVVGGWQAWDPMTQQLWYGSGSSTTRMLASKCPQANPCTLAQILGFFPNAKLLIGGIFGFKVGNSNSAAVVNVDGFTLGTTGASGPVIQYRFALSAPAPAAPVPTLDLVMLTLLAVLLGLGGIASRYRLRIKPPR